MKVYTGTDLVDVSRIRKAIDNSGDTFLKKIFTEKEIEYCNAKKAHRYESYAARFAVKEAVSKALGTGIGTEAFFLEIEVVCDTLGKPTLVLHDATLELFKKMNIVSNDISISHTEHYAVAFVVMLSED